MVASSGQCARCVIQGPIFDGVAWEFEYGGVIADAIASLKFRRQTDIARRFSACSTLPAGTWDVLVPVPLHASRLRMRGYNQSALLAGHLGRRHGLPVEVRCLSRSSRTAPQRELSFVARQNNVKGAFDLRDRPSVNGKRIVLIDDVMTTGATLSECARILRRGGAAAVGAWTVARRQ